MALSVFFGRGSKPGSDSLGLAHCWVLCVAQILNQNVPCPVPRVAPAEGLQAIRECGNAVSQDLLAHYYQHHDSVSLL